MKGEHRIQAPLERLKEHRTGLRQPAADHDRLGGQQSDRVREVERERIQGALPDLPGGNVATGRPLQNILRTGDDLPAHLGVTPGDGARRSNGLEATEATAGALRAVGDL